MGLSIIDKRKKPLEIKFSVIGVGCVFTYLDTTYMKTSSAINGGTHINAIDLLSGKFKAIDENHIVHPVDATLTINSNVLTS